MTNLFYAYRQFCVIVKLGITQIDCPQILPRHYYDNNFLLWGQLASQNCKYDKGSTYKIATVQKNVESSSTGSQLVWVLWVLQHPVFESEGTSTHGF